MRKILCVAAFAALIIFLGNCKDLANALKADPVPPTQERITGVWKVTEAYNEFDSSIISQISVPVVAFSFQDLQAFISTAGPMGMYIVYGGSEYVKIASTIGQVFDYAKLYNNELQFNVGDWYIDGGDVQQFTMVFRLAGLPGQSTLSTLLSLLNIQSQWLNTTVYHRFLNVGVEFSASPYDTMHLFFDDSTKAEYFTKDTKGTEIPWGGWQFPFHKCSFVLVRQTIGLDSLLRSVVTPHN